MKLLIVFHHRFDFWNVPLWFAERLRKEFAPLEVVRLASYEGVEEEIRDAEVVITWSLRPEQIEPARKLRWIHSPAAAVHQLLFPELVGRDIIITNGRDVHGPVVAEHVIALILALAKKLPLASRFQHRRAWGQEELWNSYPHPREVAWRHSGTGWPGHDRTQRCAPCFRARHARHRRARAPGEGQSRRRGAGFRCLAT